MISIITNIPMGSLTLAASVTAASSTVSFNDSTASNKNVVRVVNAGPNTAFMRWYQAKNGSQTAVTTDTPILNGSVEQFVIGPADTFALICAATQTATVYITPVQGM